MQTRDQLLEWWEAAQRRRGRPAPIVVLTLADRDRPTGPTLRLGGPGSPQLHIVTWMSAERALVVLVDADDLATYVERQLQLAGLQPPTPPPNPGPRA